MISSNKLRLLIFPSTAAILDGTLTILSQGDGYWRGQDIAIEELNPIGHFLLAISPGVFVACLVGWIAVFNTTILVIPRERISSWISFLIFVAHLFGASTWLIQLPYGIVWVLAVWCLARFLVYPIYRSSLLSRSEPGR